MSKNQTHIKQIARALVERTGMPYTRARKKVVAAIEAGLLPGPFTDEAVPALVALLCSPVVTSMLATEASVTAPVASTEATGDALVEAPLNWAGILRVKFPETGNRWWTVRALHGDFVVVTQQVPFENKGTLRYSVLDLRQGLRGPVNVIGQGWSGIETDRGCRTLARAMSLGVVSVSGRNNVPIRPVTIEWATPTPVDAATTFEVATLMAAGRPIKLASATTLTGLPRPIDEVHAEQVAAARMRVSKSDVAFVFRRVSVMLNAYVRVPEAFAAAARSTAQTPLQDVCARVSAEGTDELGVADVLNEYPAMFDEFVLAVVRSGAQSGELSHALRSIAETFDSEPDRILLKARSQQPQPTPH